MERDPAPGLPRMAVDAALAHPAAPKDERRGGACLPNLRSQGPSFLRGSVLDDLVAWELQNPSYDVFGHPPGGLLSPFADREGARPREGAPHAAAGLTATSTPSTILAKTGVLKPIRGRGTRDSLDWALAPAP
jgi:hypothetical protein